MTPSDSVRRALLALAVAAVAGCSTSAAPPPKLYRLPLTPPGAAPPPPAPAAGSQQWQLFAVALPDYLDRNVLMLPEGQAGLQPLTGHRWAEPLRDAVPRVLRQDLATLFGAGRVWAAPVPAGVTITRQLRVEILALEATTDHRGVRLRARWSIADPAAATAPAVDEAEVVADAAGADVDALVAAHRLALWRLAERIARSPAAL